MSRPGSKVIEAAGVLAAFSALALVATYPLAVRGLASHVPADDRDPLLMAWTLAWDASRIRAGFAGFWDAPNFFPYHHTLAYSDHLLGIAILTAPIQWLTGNPILVYNLAFLAAFVTSAAGMYVLASSLTGRRDVAVLASVAYVFAPFRLGHIAHLQWLTLGWLPLSLWGLHRYLASGAWRYLLIAAAGYLMQSLTASYFVYFALLPLAIVALAGWRSLARIPPRRLAVQLSVVAVLLAAVLVPIAIAYLDARREAGLRRSLDDITTLSADVADYVKPPSVGPWRLQGLRQGEHAVFPGAVVVVLAMVALVSGYRRDPHVRTYAIVALCAFVFSLGPQPAAWEHRLPFPGPYAWLLAIVPGLDGLRATARLGVVVLLALSVLASFGAMAIVDRLDRRVRPIVMSVLVALIVFEGWAAPIPTTAFDPLPDADTRAAYEYLRDRPRGGAIELPMSSEDSARSEFLYQYRTLLHGHPIVNGHSGYLSPLVTFLRGGHTPLRDPDHFNGLVEMLRTIGVRYLVLHADAYDDRSQLDAMLAALQPSNGHVQTGKSFGPTTVYTLTPVAPRATPPTVHRIPASAIRAEASQSADRVPMLFDGDADSRWISGRPQAGDESITLAFDRPRDVRVIRMQLATRSESDYPRELVVDSVGAEGIRILYDGPGLPLFVQGLLRDPAYPVIEIVLPENRSTAIRLRQVAATRTFAWSIHELQLFEP